MWSLCLRPDGVHAHVGHLLFIQHFGFDAVVLLAMVCAVLPAISGGKRLAGCCPGRGWSAAAGGEAQVESVFLRLVRVRRLGDDFVQFAAEAAALEAGEGVKPFSRVRPSRFKRVFSASFRP